MKFCPLSMIGDKSKECYGEKCELWNYGAEPPSCVMFSFFHTYAVSMYKYLKGMEEFDKMQNQMNKPKKPDDKDVA